MSSAVWPRICICDGVFALATLASLPAIPPLSVPVGQELPPNGKTAPTYGDGFPLLLQLLGGAGIPSVQAAPEIVAGITVNSSHGVRQRRSPLEPDRARGVTPPAAGITDGTAPVPQQVPAATAPTIAPPAIAMRLDAPAPEAAVPPAKQFPMSPLPPAEPVAAASSAVDEGRALIAPEGMQIQAVPPDAGAASAANLAMTPMGAVDRVLAAASAWRPKEAVHLEATAQETPNTGQHKDAAPPHLADGSDTPLTALAPSPPKPVPESQRTEPPFVPADAVPAAATPLVEKLRRTPDTTLRPAGIKPEPHASAAPEHEVAAPSSQAQKVTATSPGTPTEPAVDHGAQAEVAFAMHLKPISASGQRTSSPGAAPQGASDPAGGETNPVAPPIRQDTAAPEPQLPGAQPQKRKPEEPQPVHPESTAPAIARATSTPSPEAAVQREVAPEISRPEPPKAPQRSEPAAPEPPAAPKAGTPARDIKLEVTGGDRRVEVRLTEHAGELRVAVRTADSHLAGTLRENLPGLSSRLAESGFRTETWHPAAAQAGEWRRAAESSAGKAAQDSNQQSGRDRDGQQPGDADQRQAKAQQQIDRKEKGKDFAWLISSLQ